MVFLSCLIVMVISVCGIHGDLASDVKAMETRLNKLEQRQSLSSTYCNLFARGRCGKCVCRDDFKLTKKYYCDCRAEQPRRDCRDFNENGYRNINGLYVVTMNGYKNTVVYCDQRFFGGGWTVIQRRYDGSVNFYRDWLSYKNGFGDLQREFWLGNENIHLLTAQAVFPRGSEASIRISTLNDDAYMNGGSYHYSHFEVASEKAKYTLHVSSTHEKTSFPTSDKQPFSTYDRDNDNAPSHHCARDYQYAGWWINGSGDSCASTKTNLNGPYDEYKTRKPENRINFDGYSGRLQSYKILVRRL